LIDVAAPERLSINQITFPEWSLPEIVDACKRHGIGAIAPWRDRVGEIGVRRAATLVADAGLHVSSLCRGGFFTAASARARREADRENRQAVEEAAALEADSLVLVCGAPVGRDLAGARAEIARGVDRLAPFAEDAGVRLAIEPLHPMMIGERSAIVTLAEAVELAGRFDGDRVGVIVDAYHVWWDPRLRQSIEAGAGRILGFHVSDWLVPTTDVLRGRGMMGDGIIDLPTIRGWVEDAGYRGPIEVEIIDAARRHGDGDALVRLTMDRFVEAV
jgi:sugar phosphate isomerase/epimerase